MSGATGREAVTVKIQVIGREEEFAKAYNCICRCFGEQVQDAVWIAMNPAWHTPEGKAAGTARLIEQSQSVTRNDHGDANTVFLQATIPDPHDSARHIIVGVAIWDQFSMVKGLGNEPSTDVRKVLDIDKVLSGHESEQRFLQQCFASLVGPRVEAVKAKATTDSPATFSLSLCVVDPSYQRRGIAVKLVQWGLQEARRRGLLESTTEGSAMGRQVYGKLGFKPVQEVVYEVDDDFKHRALPPNLFMRTWNME